MCVKCSQLEMSAILHSHKPELCTPLHSNTLCTLYIVHRRCRLRLHLRHRFRLRYGLQCAIVVTEYICINSITFWFMDKCYLEICVVSHSVITTYAVTRPTPLTTTPTPSLIPTPTQIVIQTLQSCRMLVTSTDFDSNSNFEPHSDSDSNFPVTQDTIKHHKTS